MALQFTVGDGEFGEVYHLLAVAYLLQHTDRIAIQFKNFNEGEELFSSLNVPIREYSPQTKNHTLPSTANILFQRFYPGCLEPLAKIIIEQAQGKEWQFPYPDLATPKPKLLIWQRNKKYQCYRNSSVKLLQQLVELSRRHATIPVVVVGPAHGLSEALELGNFYEAPFFQGAESIPKQLWFLHTLFQKHGAIASVGMMSGAMDGPTMFFGHKTVFLASHRDATPRMVKVSMAVPNLIWQRIEFEGQFHKLTDAQLQELERNLWP